RKEQKKIDSILQTIDRAIEKTKALIDKYQQIKAGLMHDLFTRGIGPDGQLRPPREQAPELYQETSIGWIPKEWDIRKIGDIFSIQLGKMLSRASKTGRNELPYLGNKDVQWDRVVANELETMNFSHTEREKYKLCYGDLLVCEGGEVGRTAMWRDDLDVCFYQKAIHRLRPNAGDILSAFMLRFMFYAKTTGMLDTFTSQTSIAHLTREKLASVTMFVPPLSEQERFVTKFDGIDKKLGHERLLIEKLKKQKSGLMHDLLTGKVPIQVEPENEIESAHV
ncbi:MAG: restriction endonuclease subunit S, partial [SAR86 cluster bacterium]|nr:restriction endonuclease subunit S [SAR86 cluster bacterium]